MEIFSDVISKCGCNYFATKRINKTAVLKKFRSRTTIQVWSALLIVFTIIQSMQISVTAMAIQRTRRKHIRSLNNHTLDWENPCGGRYIPPDNNIANGSNIFKRYGRQIDYRRAAFKILRKSIRNNIQNLKVKLPGAIDISDINEWSKLNQTYKFLAQVKPQANINLTRWHRNVQVYVASFGLLRRKQEQIDQKFGHKNRQVSNELHLLLKSAKNLLCEIETAINATSKRPLQIISKEEMRHRLTLRTRNFRGSDEIEVDQIDLKFVKARYNQFLAGTAKILNRWLKHHKKTCLDNNNTDNNSSTSNLSSYSNESNNNNSSRSGRDPCHRRKRRRNVRLIRRQ